MGRVFRQAEAPTYAPAGTFRRDLIDLLRRIRRRGLPQATIRARFGTARTDVRTDEKGYFRINMAIEHSPDPEQLWHTIDLHLVAPADESLAAQGDVFIPSRHTSRVIISDIDDTVMYTGVANKIKMVWRLFFQNAHSRVAFPGVGALYQALYRGESGQARNPMLYVSRGPWILYEILTAFFNLHRIPEGPILFLRDWGLSLSRPIPRQAKGHKQALINEMLALYDDLPFVLIGDSGQHDPEIYARIVHDHPGRVEAIYIRNVSHKAARRDAIETLAKEVTRAGSSLLLAADSFAMAKHAAENGLIPEAAVATVKQERDTQLDENAPPKNQQQSDGDHLDEALDKADADEPPTIEIDPKT